MEYLYYSVRTASVFREILLPKSEENMTPAQLRKLEKLADLADAHGTHVDRSTYRLG